MFGYVKPDTPYLYNKDDKLYNAMYCAVCKSIGQNCSVMSRMTLTYDIAFLSVFCHNILGEDVNINMEHCLSHPIKKRPMATRTNLSKTLAEVNVLLAKYKIDDDIIDKTGNRLKRVVIQKGYKRARKNQPEIDNIIKTCYSSLRKLENGGETSIDKASEPFSNMLVLIGKQILNDKFTPGIEKLFYYLGKWIYLIDALDDYVKDIKNKNYNPLYFAYGDENAKKLIDNRAIDIDFIFTDIFFNMREAIEGIHFNFNSDLIQNIILRGLPQKTQNVIKGILDGKKVK